MKKVIVLSYSGCGTCKKARQWLREHQVECGERPIVDEPPTLAELTRWVPQSGKPVKNWLNTSGQSYRTLGKAKVDAADEATLMKWLAADGKLVKRPVLVCGQRVLVGFSEEEYGALFKSKS